MNIKIETVKRFEKETNLMLLFDMYDLNELYDHNININNTSKVSICGFDKDDNYINVNFTAPRKKEVDFIYLMNKVNDRLNNNYLNLCSTFKKLVPENSYAFIATSYGIGFDTFLLSFEGVKKSTQKLKEYLDSKGIVYRNEYSDAQWVYRFVISKSKENIDRINNL